MDNANILNYFLSALTRKITVPTEYHEQIKEIKRMLEDDVSGLVDSLTDFAVDSASVDFKIESDNDDFNKILQEWLDNINMEFNGQIPSGISPLAKEYFKERWKYSSFPILKIGGWTEIQGVIVPSKLYFIDGESVHAKDKNSKDQKLRILNYDYYIGSSTDYKLDNNVIITKPYGRWFDKYPTPYLIKRGVYHNWKIIESIKSKETEILDRIIPYLFLVKKGTENLYIQKDFTYNDEQLTKVLEQFKTLMQEIQELKLNTSKTSVPTRVTNFDEEIKHLIPDLSAIFNKDLFASAERNILAGLGFIDVVEAVSTSRRESILNPKAFIEEVKTGVKDFKQILKELIKIIIEKNKEDHPKWVNYEWYISSSPVRAFMTAEFKDHIRQLYDRGRVSSKTAVELIGEVDFETEVYRREKEDLEGIQETMYPPITRNQEGQGIDLPGFSPESEIDEEEIPEDKKDEIEKQEYDVGSLEGAPYQNINQLPKQVKENVSKDLQSVFLRVFNNALKQYQNETRAFRVAWSVIRQIGRKNKKGIWVRKRKRVEGKLEPLSLNKAIIDKALEEEEKSIIDEAMKLKDLELKEKEKVLKEKKEKLLDKLLGNKEGKE